MSSTVKKKKIDYAALNTSFMRIKGVHIETARDLLDLGFHEWYQLKGRSPEVLFEDLKKLKTDVKQDRLKGLRVVVEYAEGH